ncbi:MAG: hypothetical protein L0Y76_08565 [Ignavibacteria bacterium]|nr:hypothetical protein [Ignavibacteria bacterium]
MRNHHLTGGGFLRGNQCGKSLYLNVHYPELEVKKYDKSRDNLLKRKTAAALTKHLFPNGKFSGFNVTGNFDLACSLTKRLIDEKTCTIFNSCFSHDNNYCVIDILHNDHGYWKAYSLRDKDDPFDDTILLCSLQYFITKRNKFDIYDYFAIEYSIKPEEKGRISLDYHISCIKEHISLLQDFVGKKVHDFRILLDSSQIPDTQTGEHCIRPRPCEYHDFCKYSGKSIDN